MQAERRHIPAEHRPAAEARAPLDVGLVLSDPVAPSNGELRLLDHLCADPRYRIAWLRQGQTTGAAPGRRDLRAAVEARVVPLPAAYATRHWRGGVAGPVQGEETPCDVILDFGTGTDADVLAGRARCGLWRLSAYAPGAGVAEAMGGLPATAVTLERVTAGGVRTRLDQAVYDTKFLARRNTAYIREKSVQMTIRALARLYRDGALAPAAGLPLPQPARATLAGYGLRTARKLSGRIADRLSARLGRPTDGFNLRVGFGDIGTFDPARGQDVAMPRGHFWADPFLVEQDGRVYCLFEDYDFDTRLGQIGAGLLTDTGMEYLGQAHGAPHHLSFPFVFRHGGEIYMMPETHRAGRLEIWRATDFPLGWTLHATAFEGHGLADSVLFRQGADWWLFTGYCTDSFGDFCGELHLFRTSGPDLAWMEPHPLNPVVIGANVARSGGRVHAAGGRLYRVSQDNSGGTYGWGLNVMEIVQLSREDYAERRVRHVTPDFAPGILGCHHFDCAGGRWVMDINRERALHSS